MTNFEKIKAMTIEEFAKKFSSSICENISKCCDYDDCNDCIINFLNKEEEECQKNLKK